MAEDGQVSASTMKALGLGNAQVVSDAEGMEVRGMASIAASGGLSIVAGQLSAPLGSGNVAALDANFAFGAAAHLAPVASTAGHAQGSSAAATLTVAHPLFNYSASFSVATGGYGAAYAQ